MRLFDQVWAMFTYAWDVMTSYIFDFFDTLGVWGVIVAVIFSMLVVRNILYPLMKEGVVSGVGMSDRASKNRPMDAEFREVD